MPKSITTALPFVTHNPTFDGRGVIVGVFDTGVDSLARGLNGDDKVIDIVDCTGSGDLMCKKAEPKDNTLATPAGPVTLPSTAPPTSAYYVGIKRAYELYPKKLVNRVSAERKKEFLDCHKKHLAVAKEKSDELEAKGDKTKEGIKARKNAKAIVDSLTAATSDYDDHGPIKIVVVQCSPDNHPCAYILDMEKDFTSSTPPTLSSLMYSFDHNRAVAKFDDSSMLNFCLNFETPTEDGILVTITTDAGAHGSHVSGIVAADLQDESMNGVAPGAKIVSLKIGDSRLGSMETGVGVVRALTEAKKRGCHIVNMSYGEASAVANSGRIADLIDEMVYKDNIIFVSSAGNNGPALMTVGAPGGLNKSIISVGAHVDTSMMVSDYSMREIAGAGTNYTWSSVGPAPDGMNGVDIIAPGGAITSVPEWCLQKNQLMNGTSMSSPNCAGCIALLLSALIQQNVPYNAERVKKAVFNTAKLMPDLSTLVQGNGMIQVEKAYEHLMSYKDELSEEVRFETTINRAATPNGVYLRQHEECNKRQTYSVTVDPKFGFKDDDRSIETQTKRVEFEMRMNLELSVEDCDWVSFPDHVVLMHNGRSFSIEVNPCDLPSGLHTIHLIGYDSSNPARGAMFKLPITVVKPKPLDTSDVAPNLGQMNFAPAERKRFFITPPTGATYCDITIKDCRSPKDDASSRLVVLHTLQSFPHTPYRDNEKQRYLNLSPGESSVTGVACTGGVTMEICLARYWSALGLTEVSCDVRYRGATPTPSSVNISAAGSGTHVRLQSIVSDEVVSPVAKLDKFLTYLTPKDSKIEAMPGDRNLLLDGITRTYGLTLTYSLSLDEDASITCVVPTLNGYLYESAMESQFVMVYDSSKKLLGVSDCWPDPIKCKKGDITIRLQVRHSSIDVLKKFEGQVLAIERSLKSPVTLDVYATHCDMVLGKKKFGKRILPQGNMVSAHFSLPSRPKGVKEGDVLKGKVQYESSDSDLPGAGKRPGGWPITLAIGPKEKDTKKEEKPEVSEVKDEMGEVEKMEEELRDWKVGKVEKKIGEDGFDALYDNALKSYDGWLPLMAAKVKHLEKKKAEGWEKSVVALVDGIVKRIDTDRIAKWGGMKHDLTDGVVVKEKKEVDREKGILIDCLGRKCLALVGDEGFDGAVKELKKWVKVEGADKYAVVEIEECKKAKHGGLVLEIIKRLGDGSGSKGGLKVYDKKELLEIREKIYEELKWDWLGEYSKCWKVLEAPADFQEFN